MVSVRTPSVCLCLSVCLSVTLVDQGHIGRKSWKLIARTISPTPSLLARTITRVHRNKANEKFWRKGSVGVSRDCPIFRVPPIISGTGKVYGFQIRPVHSEGPSEQKPIKNFREKGACGCIQGLPNFFGYPLSSQEREKLYGFQL